MGGSIPAHCEMKHGQGADHVIWPQFCGTRLAALSLNALGVNLYTARPSLTRWCSSCAADVQQPCTGCSADSLYTHLVHSDDLPGFSLITGPGMYTLYVLVLRSDAQPRLMASMALEARFPFSCRSMFRCNHALHTNSLNLQRSFFSPYKRQYEVFLI